jgi:tetratricopeptide (TPR) repeat protein
MRRAMNTLAHYTPAFSAALLIHALAVGAASGCFAPRAAYQTPPDRRATAMAIFAVPPPEDSRFPGLTPIDEIDLERGIAPDAPAQISLGDFTYDIIKIVERAKVLFPFVTPGLAWEHFVTTPNQTSGVPDPFGTVRSAKRAPSRHALYLDETALQKLLDRSWSRRHRWTAFNPIVRVTQIYSADAGQLPHVLQRYCDENSLQVYTDTTVRDPRMWVQLGIAADHADFIGFIRRYVSEHPSTKATTALLFLLDSMAQGSRDALAPLLEIDPDNELVWTQNASPRAYGLLVQLRQYYERELNRRGLTSAEAITVFYENIRLRILTEIVQTSPDRYRASDARFLIGTIYWRQERYREALSAWQQMSIDASDSHVEAYSQVLRIIHKYGARDTSRNGVDAMVLRDIDHVLTNANGRWVMSSYDRLHRFGYRADTF